MGVLDPRLGAPHAEALLERYRQRGEAEKDFGDWQQALPRSSVPCIPYPISTPAA